MRPICSSRPASWPARRGTTRERARSCARRAAAIRRAAELAEWRVGGARKAQELYQAAAEAYPQSTAALTQLGRLGSWAGDYPAAARAYQQLAQAAQSISERNESRRWAASL